MNEKHIESIINAYKKLRTEHPDFWLTDCSIAKNISQAIKLAATARNLAGRKHSHQFRIPNDILTKFANKILLIELQVINVGSFGELFNMIEHCRVKGVSELTIYDTAQRIGCFLNLYPEEIYLHRGTRIGAEILLGKLRGRSISIDRLPSPFHDGLSASEIEDILCIYKDRLAKCV